MTIYQLQNWEGLIRQNNENQYLHSDDYLNMSPNDLVLPMARLTRDMKHTTGPNRADLIPFWNGKHKKDFILQSFESFQDTKRCRKFKAYIGQMFPGFMLNPDNGYAVNEGQIKRLSVKLRKNLWKMVDEDETFPIGKSKVTAGRLIDLLSLTLTNTLDKQVIVWKKD